MNEAGAGSPPPWIHFWFGYDYLDITRYGWIQTNAIGICMNKSIWQYFLYQGPKKSNMYEGRGRRAHPASEDILGPIRLDMVVYMLTKLNWIVWCGPKKYSSSWNQNGTYRKFGPKSKSTVLSPVFFSLTDWWPVFVHVKSGLRRESASGKHKILCCFFSSPTVNFGVHKTWNV